MASSIALIAGLAFFQSAAQEPPAWPQFRGPAGTGLAAERANPPVEFSPDKKPQWRADLPFGHSSPSIWGDRIFLTGFDKEAKKLEVLSLDRKTGAILWRRTVPAEKIETVHDISSPATATAIVDGERVYAYFGSFGLIAFDFQGKEQWTLPLPIPTTPYGSGSSPVLADDLIILSRDESSDPCLLAVDRAASPRRSGRIRSQDGRAEMVGQDHDPGVRYTRCGTRRDLRGHLVQHRRTGPDHIADLRQPPEI